MRRIHKPNKDYIVLYSVYTVKKNRSDETSGEKNIALKFRITQKCLNKLLIRAALWLF